MINLLRKNTLTAAVAIGAAGLGGAAIAGAASNGSSNAKSNSAKAQQRPGQPPQREQLSADDAAKVKQAALDKVPGATVLRTEAGGPYSTPYHAHIKTSDGKLQIVLVNGSFEATAVQADRGPRGRGGPGGVGGGRFPGDHKPETALTGETKQKVEDAVLARYPGATTVRTETNTDGDAPYESHITTTDGKELEVLVNKDFEVVGANEHPSRP
jgi:hypothetical protein